MHILVKTIYVATAQTWTFLEMIACKIVKFCAALMQTCENSKKFEKWNMNSASKWKQILNYGERLLEWLGGSRPYKLESIEGGCRLRFLKGYHIKWNTFAALNALIIDSTSKNFISLKAIKFAINQRIKFFKTFYMPTTNPIKPIPPTSFINFPLMLFISLFVIGNATFCVQKYLLVVCSLC